MSWKDTEAHQYTVNMTRNSGELVVDKIKIYQFNHQVIYEHDNQEGREGHVSTNSSDRSDSDNTETMSYVKIKLVGLSRTQNGNGHQDDMQQIVSTQQVTNIKDIMNALLRYLENLQLGREKGKGKQV